MNTKISRQLCCTLFITLAVVLLAAAGGHAAKKPVKPTYEWRVEIVDYGGFQLRGDGEGPYEHEDAGPVQAWVDTMGPDPLGTSSFNLRITNNSERTISLQNVTVSDLGMDLEEGPGYFPADGCDAPDPDFCGDEGDCASRLTDFLNRSHIRCGYAFVALRINVSLDIESMEVGEMVSLENDDLILLTISNTDENAGVPPSDQFHNLQAQNLQKDATSRYSPLSVTRMGPDTWTIRVDAWNNGEEPLNFMNYYEFYYAPLGRGKHLVPKIPMAAYGPFNFEMIWTRIPIGGK